MTRQGYCLKKDEIVEDRKLADYCLSAGNFKTICKNLALLEKNDRGVKKILPIKLAN